MELLLMRRRRAVFSDFTSLVADLIAVRDKIIDLQALLPE